jgi:molybdate transport system substrate-binding protein
MNRLQTSDRGRSRIVRVAIVVLALLVPWGPRPRAEQTSAPPVVVLCSVAVESVLQGLRPTLLRDARVNLQASCDLAASVADRVRSGAAFDLLVLTPGLIDALVAEGRLAPTSRVLLGRSPVALAQRTGGPRRDVSTPDRLRAVLTASPSIAFARIGVSGTVFTTLLTKWGVAEAFAPKLKPLGAGSDVTAAVIRGDADLGVLPVSEILPVAGLEVAGRFPAELAAYVVMEAAASARAADAPSVKTFLAFLRSPEATRAFERAGFDAR